MRQLLGHPRVLEDLLESYSALSRGEHPFDQVLDITGEVFGLRDCVSRKVLLKVNYIFLTFSMIYLSF